MAPNSLRLGFDAADRAEESDGAVKNAQTALHLDGEVHMTGRVDDVDVGVAPVTGGGGRGDRDTTFLFLGHPVHHRSTLVDLAHLVRLARVVENALGSRGLTGVDVRHDADVARLFQRVLSHAPRHSLLHVKEPLTGRRRVRGRERLPAVVGEGPVGLRHAEDVVLLLERAALTRE